MQSGMMLLHPHYSGVDARMEILLESGKSKVFILIKCAKFMKYSKNEIDE